jgi:hypothetical protein
MKDVTGHNFNSETLRRESGIDSPVAGLTSATEDFTWIVEGSGGELAVLQTNDVPAGARVIRIDMNTSAMGRNYPTDLALVGDIRDELAELPEAVTSLLQPEHRNITAGERSAEISAFTAEARATARAASQKNFGQTPIHPDELLQVLAESLDANAVIVCENTTAPYGPFAFGFRDDEQMFISTAGANLGWGVNGEKVEHPEQLKPPLDRGKTATRGGKPYLVEVTTARSGPRAESVWYERVPSP